MFRKAGSLDESIDTVHGELCAEAGQCCRNNQYSQGGIRMEPWALRLIF